MPRRSAGILLFRRPDAGGSPEVLLVHPGGPFWAKRDAGAWSIPKGEVDPGEEAEACARREFAEELGSPLAGTALEPLGEVRQKGGKVVEAWAAEGDLDADAIRSTTFTVEWPPRSGRTQSFPEVDRAGWFGLDAAREKLLPAQTPFLDRLAERLGGRVPGCGRSASSASPGSPGVDPPRLWTIGYERLAPGALVAELEAAGVQRVIDVRFRPQSRRPGMSKTRLGALLGEHGIGYEHRRALGTPADLRWLFHRGRIAEAASAFSKHVEAAHPDALDALAAELDDGPRTALLCLEADPATCHRRVLTDAVRARRGGDLEVVDL